MENEKEASLHIHSITSPYLNGYQYTSVLGSKRRVHVTNILLTLSQNTSGCTGVYRHPRSANRSGS